MDPGAPRWVQNPSRDPRVSDHKAHSNSCGGGGPLLRRREGLRDPHRFFHPWIGLQSVGDLPFGPEEHVSFHQTLQRPAPGAGLQEIGLFRPQGRPPVHRRGGEDPWGELLHQCPTADQEQGQPGPSRPCGILLHQDHRRAAQVLQVNPSWMSKARREVGGS